MSFFDLNPCCDCVTGPRIISYQNVMGNYNLDNFSKKNNATLDRTSLPIAVDKSTRSVIKNSLPSNANIVNTKNSSKSSFSLSENTDFDKYVLPKIEEDFKNEDKTKITETITELEEQLNALPDTTENWDARYDIRAKIRALNNGYDSIYNYYVGEEVKRAKTAIADNTGKYSRMIEKGKAEEAKQQKLNEELEKATPHKRLQYEIIQATNPMFDDEHVGIRSPADIKTFEEVIEDEESFNWGDYSKEDALRDLKRNKVTLYSSYPIKNGVFVSTSRVQAEQYAGGQGNRVYSKTVSPDKVAWINGDEGQYASSTAKYSHSNTPWQDYLDNNFPTSGTRTFGLPTAEQLNQPSQEMIEAAQALTLERKDKKINLTDVTDLSVEDVSLPIAKYKAKKDANTIYQRSAYENIGNSKIISEEVKNRLEPTTYIQKKNDDVLKKAYERLEKNGDIKANALEWFTTDIKDVKDIDVAMGAILLEQYQQNKDYESAVKVVQKLADMGTEAGRAVQMYSIFQRLTPDSMMIYQQKKLDSAFKELTRSKTKEWIEQNQDKFIITSEDAEFIVAKVQEAQNAPTERQKQIALAEIEKRVNDKLPPEAGQSVKAFRRIAMLFNPKTQVRNIVGNVTVMPLNYVTDLVATGIDKAIAKKTGLRTTALPNMKTIKEGFKKGASETIDDFKRGIRTTPTGSRYEIQNNAKSFDENFSFNENYMGPFKIVNTTVNATNKVLNKLGINKPIKWLNNKANGIDRVLSTSLELGDRPFYEAAYQNALEGQMRVNEVTEPTQEMIDIASNVALSQTWQDNNNYTRFVLGVRNAFNIANINGFGLGDLIIPFAKTPANLTKAMVEYSPAGVIPAIINYTDMQRAISRGEMTPMQQKKFVTSVGKAVAGTVLYVIANGLVKGGKITGSSDEDKDVANFEKNVLGIQPYSIRIGDKTYTYNWAQPLAAPLAIMSDTYKMSAEGAKWNEILLNAFKVGGDQLVANSFLQGIQDLFSSQYGDEGFGAKFIDALADLPAQFTPTLVGQIATQFDSTKRQTYENGDTVGTMINEVKNKIPGVKNTLAPQVNTFGEEIQNYGGANNPFNVFLNPGNISSANATETQKELYELYQDTKDKTIFPMQAPYSISGGGEKVKLSSHDRAEYQKASGQYVTKQLDALFDSEFYKTLENEKKVSVVNKIVTDANTTAKDKWIDNDATKDLAELQTELKEAGIPLIDYYNAWVAQKDVEGKKNYKGETISGTKKANKIKAIKEATGLSQYKANKLYEILN